MIVVTGGAGFIGSNLIWALNHAGEREVAVVDRLRTPTQHLNLNRLQIVDLLDPADEAGVDRCCQAAEAIFHLGACTDTTEADGRYVIENNFTQSKRLLHLALARQIPFVYASSAAVYGDGASGFCEEPRCEQPLNLYAFSKLMLDNHVRQLLPRAASPVCGLRYFNVYGPQERHKGAMASVALQLYDQLRATRELRLFEGSRDFRRDFVHVDDVVRVTLWARRARARGIFNCGTGAARSFYDLAAIMQRLDGGGAPIRLVEFPAKLRGKYQAFTQADLTALRHAGCDEPFLGLEEGVARYHALLAASDGFLPLAAARRD
jgi:ADP-L-glycero-D-manno-heptose 6-epimerase